ncbi:MAG TPA: HAMP domain-containing sensor histidine kinase [Phycisphaerales bacterium]|nr:HAMP domain-containing sensor histidine kinase [Phycisphaerales bacterium]
MLQGMSLAKKCLLVFGAATTLIVLLALVVPWMRMTYLIDEGQLEVSRQMVDTWQRVGEEQGRASLMGPPAPGSTMRVVPRLVEDIREVRAGVEAREISREQIVRENEAFLGRAVAALEADPSQPDFQEASWDGSQREYRYAKGVWRATEGTRKLVGLVELQRRSVSATRLLVLNTTFVFVAFLWIFLLAMAVFWFITRRLVLQPVRELTDATQRVREGNLNIRAEITTGDEFQQLGDTLNSMLSDLQASQDRLRGINSALDVKLHELAEANSALYQAAKVKGEFLASVSHELRTPLNSINGFAELLLEVAKADADKPDASPIVLKRIRYLENILTAGRGLLALINSLLEMARIEAGKVDLRIERVTLREACEGLLGLISPQAGRKGITLKLEVADDVPIIKTDPRKFQQIIFNFLSNAVKFIQPLEKTGREPIIILRAERLPATSVDTQERIRVSVIDNGPGIPPEQQDRIFEKFVQLDSGYTKEQQSGTGLGLAICKDLATVLQSEIQLISDVGQGSMFSLIMPVAMSSATADVVEAEEERREAAMSEMRERNGSR